MKNDHFELEVSILFQVSIYEYTEIEPSKFMVQYTPKSEGHMRRLVPQYAELVEASESVESTER